MIMTRIEDREGPTGVREINLRAFGGRTEADLVDQLRVSCPDAISLVAEDEGRLVGQRSGIGSRLVESGFDAVRAAGHPFVVVLGHPEYYPRFPGRPIHFSGSVVALRRVPVRGRKTTRDK